MPFIFYCYQRPLHGGVRERAVQRERDRERQRERLAMEGERIIFLGLKISMECIK